MSRLLHTATGHYYKSVVYITKTTVRKPLTNNKNQAFIWTI